MNNEAVPPNRSVLLELQRTTHLTLHALAGELAHLELTASELNALANLAAAPAPTASQLAAAMGIRPTTLTSVLDRLERRGHVVRGSRPGDRRAVVIQLTDSGREVAAAVRRAFADLEDKALAAVPGRDVATLYQVLAALAGAAR